MKRLQSFEFWFIGILVFGGLPTACTTTIEDYTKAIELNPDDAEAYHNRGAAYYDLGNLELAIKDYTKAIELDPDFARTYINRGLAYRLSGNLDKAIKDYERYLELFPLATNKEEVISVIEELKLKLK